MKVTSNLPIRESGKEEKQPELPMLGECKVIRRQRHEVQNVSNCTFSPVQTPKRRIREHSTLNPQKKYQDHNMKSFPALR